jgi:hypothetical protein
MLWNNVSELFASKMNSLNIQQIIFTLFFNAKPNIIKTYLT